MDLFQHPPPAPAGGGKTVLTRGSGAVVVDGKWTNEVAWAGSLRRLRGSGARAPSHLSHRQWPSTRPRWDRSQAGGGNPIPSRPELRYRVAASKPVLAREFGQRA